jgi:hypothetical protein
LIFDVSRSKFVMRSLKFLKVRKRLKRRQCF